jgi:hypothetical protein
MAKVPKPAASKARQLIAGMPFWPDALKAVGQRATISRRWAESRGARAGTFPMEATDLLLLRS